MAHRTILTERQRAALFDLPTTEVEMLRHYILADDDIEHIQARRRPENQISFALQLCVLRYPGRRLSQREVIPDKLLRCIGAQLGITSEAFLAYAARRQTRQEHLEALRAIYGYKMFIIIANWPDILRCAATMVADAIPPSQLLRKFASYPRQHALAEAQHFRMADLNLLAALIPNRPQPVLLHDLWVYQILSGVGATFISDDMPGLLYRQHRGNQIGANDGLRAQIMRFGMMMQGTYAMWNQRNLAAIRPALHRFTPENQEIFYKFERARQAERWWTRASGLRASQVYRQGRLSHLALYFTALTNRI